MACGGAPHSVIPRVVGSPESLGPGKTLSSFPPPPASHFQQAALPLGFSTLDSLQGISGSIKWCKQIVFIMIILGLTSWPCVTENWGLFVRTAWGKRPFFFFCLLPESVLFSFPQFWILSCLDPFLHTPSLPPAGFV